MMTKKKKDADADENEEIVFEDAFDAEKRALEKVKKALKVCEKERKEYLDGWKRAKADALNEKRRQKDFLEQEQHRSLQKCIVTVLPILDSARAALRQASDANAVQAGVERIHTQCLRSFSDLGVVLIDSTGESFDPLRHQSIGERTVADKKDENTVVEVVRVGACVGEVIIRPAMVYVGVCGKDVDKSG